MSSTRCASFCDSVWSLFRKKSTKNINDPRNGERMIGGADERMEPLEWAKFAVRNKVEDDYPAALSILSSKADQGNDEAEFYLGLLYARGQGVARDFRLAREWMQRS